MLKPEAASEGPMFQLSTADLGNTLIYLGYRTLHGNQPDEAVLNERLKSEIAGLEETDPELHERLLLASISAATDNDRWANESLSLEDALYSEDDAPRQPGELHEDMISALDDVVTVDDLYDRFDEDDDDEDTLVGGALLLGAVATHVLLRDATSATVPPLTESHDALETLEAEATVIGSYMGLAEDDNPEVGKMTKYLETVYIPRLRVEPDIDHCISDLSGIFPEDKEARQAFRIGAAIVVAAARLSVIDRRQRG